MGSRHAIQKEGYLHFRSNSNSLGEKVDSPCTDSCAPLHRHYCRSRRAYSEILSFSERHVVIHNRVLSICTVGKITLLCVPEVCADVISKFSSLDVYYFLHILATNASQTKVIQTMKL